MKISIRLANIDDTAQILALWRRFMAEEEQAVPDADLGKAEMAWTARLRTQIGCSKVVVADSDHGLVGFLSFINQSDRDWVPRETAYVVDIYVTPEARASSAARGLFGTASILLRTAYSETWTNTHVKNRRLHALLKRAGFEPLHDFQIEGLRDQIYFRLDNHAMQSPARSSRR